MATAPMSKQDIIRAHAELEQLQLDMARRSAGGKQTSGRYKKHDSARNVFIQTVAMPSLRMGKRIDAYQATEVASNRAADLLVNLVDAKALPKCKIYDTVEEFRNPRHDEFKGGSLWTLYNGVTEHLKGGDLTRLAARTMKVQGIFDKVAGHRPTIIEVDAEEVALPA